MDVANVTLRTSSSFYSTWPHRRPRYHRFVKVVSSRLVFASFSPLAPTHIILIAHGDDEGDTARHYAAGTSSVVFSKRFIVGSSLLASSAGTSTFSPSPAAASASSLHFAHVHVNFHPACSSVRRASSGCATSMNATLSSSPLAMSRVAMSLSSAEPSVASSVVSSGFASAALSPSKEGRALGVQECER